jgi:hypothetical protein
MKHNVAEELRTIKENLRLEIIGFVSTKLSEFSETTGFSVSSLDIEFVKIQQIGERPKFVIKDLQIGIE